VTGMARGRALLSLAKWTLVPTDDVVMGAAATPPALEPHPGFPKGLPAQGLTRPTGHGLDPPRSVPAPHRRRAVHGGGLSRRVVVRQQPLRVHCVGSRGQLLPQPGGGGDGHGPELRHEDGAHTETETEAHVPAHGTTPGPTEVSRHGRTLRPLRRHRHASPYSKIP
jgi:hypothetical protein